MQNDILKEFMVRNTYIYPPQPSMRIVADIIGYTAKRHAALQLHIDFRLSHAGSRRDAVQELGFTIADGIEYVRAALKSGLEVDAVRAALVVLLWHWHELVHGGGKAARCTLAVVDIDGTSYSSPKDQRSLMLRTHCQTSACSSHRPGSLQQHNSHDCRGVGCRTRWHSVVTHQLFR